VGRSGHRIGTPNRAYPQYDGGIRQNSSVERAGKIESGKEAVVDHEEVVKGGDPPVGDGENL
jgi:hypothetical protein